MKKILMLVLVAMVIFTGCNRSENENGVGRLSVRLTDVPGDYDTVMVDIEQLFVHVTGEDSSEWVELELEINDPINLLDLTNDKDTLLAELDFPVGKISQMRMVLGDDNSVTVEGETVGENTTYTTYPLETPSALQSGLKFNIHAEIQEGVTYRMWIDFDASRSIVKRGNGSYALKPTIKVFTENTSGAIKGVVAPAKAIPAKVHAIIETEEGDKDTIVTTTTEDNGDFLLKGLDEASYKVSVEASEAYAGNDIENVEVTVGIVTDVDTIKVNLLP